MTPEQYCQDKTAKSGSSFYYSFLFLPSHKRLAITALYAFCREVDDVVDECTDIEIARTKLAWWRNEIDNLFNDNPQHPVTNALLEPTKDFNLPREHFYEILDGMEMDLDYSSYGSFKNLSLYCHRVASIVGLMAAEIFGYKNRNTLKFAHHLGMAFQLTNILRDVREDFSRNRLYIPLDELDKFGVSVSDIESFKTSSNIQALFKFQAQRARQYYDQAFEQLPNEDRFNQLSGLIMANIYIATLEEIENDGFRVLQNRIKLTPLRKLWVAWKTVRQEKQRIKSLA
ncbi:MAG: presqualene diphosphate synthase HpnD [Gammaproteobacteria bacterium]